MSEPSRQPPAATAVGSGEVSAPAGARPGPKHRNRFGAGRESLLRRLGSVLRDLVDWRPRTVSVPRAGCRFITLDLRNVPPRYRLSSVRLQLHQLAGLPRAGFAFRMHGENAAVWYWDESSLDPARLAAPAPLSANGISPWPESLLRASLSDGLHLVACATGVEAVAVNAGHVVRSRWFRELPGDDLWAAFVRDAGREPGACPRPALATRLSVAAPPRGWSAWTTLRQPLPVALLAGVAVLAVLGAGFVAGGVYQYKIESSLAAERAVLHRLRKNNATAIALQDKLDAAAAYVAAIDQVRAPVLHLELFKTFAASGLLGESTKVSLYEWEYRNGRLRILFQVPQEGFSLNEFLARLEELGALEDIHLLPDAPQGLVGIQARVRGAGPASAAVPAGKAG